ncbi:SRPBCC family protein [Allohahella marinimesophila]|uniref:Polyketide cyclase/dehydrase/lipid transport protein n=1 Tax=Allohahella marinimesophila TaxID=1054972 RepID=A0ABP7NYX4_9GAMM
MHLLAKKRVKINRPTSVVFDYVTDMEQFPEWFPEIREVRSGNELAHGQIGKTYFETVKMPFGNTREIRLIVRDSIADRLFVTEAHFPPILPRMEVIFHELSEEQCAIDWQMFSRSRSFVIWLCLLPLLRRVMTRRAARAMVQLKAALEAERPHLQIFDETG